MTALVDLHPSTESQQRELDPLIDRLRTALCDLPEPAIAAERAAACLRTHLPRPNILSADEQLGSAEHYQQHVLHVDDQLAFSIVALVWQPQQRTTIHDHRCWGAVAVLRGTEHETLYSFERIRLRNRLVAGHQRDYPAGDVSAFAPPGDIHQVRNPGPSTAISLHVYGADIAALGSSIRRNYPASLVAA